MKLVWLALFALALAWALVREPLLPDEDDCAVRGKASTCWEEAR